MALLVVGLLGGCADGPGAGEGGGGGGAALLRGFSVQVDEAVAAKVPAVHLKVCGDWGCHEQDVTLLISGPTSAAPCRSGDGAADVCGVVRLPGPGPGYGYAPVPQLTPDPVTVTVTTPPGAPLAIAAELTVRAPVVCQGRPAREEGCADGVPQATLRIAADATVSQVG
ncbi:hypothetical protein [Dactylosporangium sp. NPDC000521]|uniref:hypothetical protein n=1 Tax=Dactylosporangium sp. NPDC000521 TaxID=3363975 RepID=UPI0036CE71F9